MKKGRLRRAPRRESEPSLSRRAFIQASAGSSLLGTAGAWMGGCETARKSSDGQWPVIDYGQSFISGKACSNRVRFWVESRTRILDERTGKTQDYYQCASCKSENTFAREGLFMEDNYDFIPIFGPEDGLIFRRKAYLNPRYREWRKAEDLWGGANLSTESASSHPPGFDDGRYPPSHRTSSSPGRPNRNKPGRHRLDGHL